MTDAELVANLCAHLNQARMREALLLQALLKIANWGPMAVDDQRWTLAKDAIKAHAND
jgi:hypothetical protein